MNKIVFGYNSYGTIYGTVNNYDSNGNITGFQNLNGYGIFFSVADKWQDSDIRMLVRKFVGSGITIVSGTSTPSGSSGNFLITFSSSDLCFPPSEYVYTLHISPSATTYIDGTTQVKCIGSGIFEITKGFKP
jgi:hypothetical protein